MAKKSKSKKRSVAKGKRSVAKKSAAKKKARPMKAKAKKGGAARKVAKKAAAPKKAKSRAKVAKKAAPKAEGSRAARGPAKTCSAAGSGTDDLAAGHAGLRATGIDVDSRHGADWRFKEPPKARLGAHQPLERARAATVREYSGGERFGVDVHMLVEHAFEQAAQIGRRP